MRGMPRSARITVPANGLLVFATDHGDVTGSAPN
jgi:hypothetical protein